MTARCAPSSASAWQMRCPSPPLPPVTSATMPFRSIASLPKCECVVAFVGEADGEGKRHQVGKGPRSLQRSVFRYDGLPECVVQAGADDIVGHMRRGCRAGDTAGVEGRAECRVERDRERVVDGAQID